MSMFMQVFMCANMWCGVVWCVCVSECECVSVCECECVSVVW